jgi:hypothetical protein
MFATHQATILAVDPDLALHNKLCPFTQEGQRALPAPSIADALAALATCHVERILIDGDSVSGPAGWADRRPLHAAAGTIPLVILAPAGAVPCAGYRSSGFVDLVVPLLNAATPANDTLVLV